MRCVAPLRRRLVVEPSSLVDETGFDRRRTFIFSDFAYMGGEFYKNCIRIAKARASRLRISRGWRLNSSGAVCKHEPGTRHLRLHGRIQHRPDWVSSRAGA